MKTSYRERDYGYGEAMHKLRTAIGLTQEELGKLIGVSRRSVAEWEAGCSYPKTERLKALIELAVQRQAFSTGREAQEIRQLWRVAHKKVLLDEDWLCALLSQRNSPQDQEGEIVQISDTRQEIRAVGIVPSADPACPYSVAPEPGADPVPCSNLLPPLTPVPSVEGTMSSAVPVVPQRTEAETIGSPSPTVEMRSAQASGSVQDTISTIGARPNPRSDKTRGRNIRLLSVVLTLVILAITGTGGMLLLHISPLQTHSYPRYLSGNGTLAFFDPLSRQDESKWTSYGPDSLGASCQFTGGTYHVSQQQTNQSNWCPAYGIFSNFTFEVQLTITQGDCGGVFFRFEGNRNFYEFTMCQNGKYWVIKYISNSGSILQQSNSSAIRTGLGQHNKIAVVDSGNTMIFYVNERPIDQEQDSNNISGKIALIASPYSPYGGHATDVAYSNAKLWTL